MKMIPLTQGKFAKIDDQDYDRLVQYKWFAHNGHGCWSARCAQTKPALKMHRFIMNAPDGTVVDHANGDGLDNRRSNLRICTQTDNMHNLKMHKDNLTGFKGVHWNKRRQVYQAYIMINKKHIYLGAFKTAWDAAHAYDRAARKYHGSFARLNFPE